MNGINRRSQKVVCITTFEIFGKDGNKYAGQVPQLDEVYTVADFADNRGFIAEPHLEAAIHLVEIESPYLEKSRHRIGWPILGFLPVDDRETDISTLMPAPVRRLEDA